jgi:hypothetical protein
MSITLSIRLPEGIVLAADSFVTVQAEAVPKEELIKCPSCGSKIPQAALVPSPPIPLSTSIYGEKIYKLTERIALLSFGISFLKGRSIRAHIEELIPQFSNNERVVSVVERIKAYFKYLLEEEMISISLPPHEYPIGLQIAGYDEGESYIGKTYVVKLGRDEIVEPVHEHGFGCTFGGDGRIIQKLWKEDPSIPIATPNYQFLSLHDAIDYAYFLVHTTIEYQRFATMMPTCGGEIEIAVITYSEGFRWIRKRKLELSYPIKDV